jgi:hypothetical protein
LGQLLSWPVRFLSWICYWLTFELGQVLEEKNNVSLSSDDPSKLLPSIASFLLGLVLVKSYGESFDNVSTWEIEILALNVLTCKRNFGTERIRRKEPRSIFIDVFLPKVRFVLKQRYRITRGVALFTSKIYIPFIM